MSSQDYPLSPEEHDRLDRLASEVRRGGGLALPDFFGALLEELLDNGPTDNARLVRIVADVGANKSKKVKETWGNSYEFLTSDLMAQLACNGYVTKAPTPPTAADARWSLGPEFRPGVRLEIIPHRVGLNPPVGTTVWEKEEREALSRASQLRFQRKEIAYLIREGRTDKRIALCGHKDKKLIAELRAELGIPNPTEEWRPTS